MQKRYWNFKDDDLTRDLVSWNNALFPPGLYRGFDFVAQASMILRLGHSVNGYTYPKEDLSGLTASLGMWRSNQGVNIVEDDFIDLPVSVNGTGNPRIDIVVGTHNYLAIEGGVQAVYSIVQGTPGASPVAPAVINSLTDLIIGYLYVPAGTTALNQTGVAFTRSDFPRLGAKPDDFNNNNIYSSTHYVANGDDRKVSIGKLDLAIYNVQQNINDVSKALALAEIGHYTTNDLVVMYGGTITGTNPGAIEIEETGIYYNGIIYKIPLTDITTSGAQVPVWKIVSGVMSLVPGPVGGAGISGYIADYNSPTIKYLSYQSDENADVYSSVSISTNVGTGNIASSSAQIRAIRNGKMINAVVKLLITTNSTPIVLNIYPVVKFTMTPLYKGKFHSVFSSIIGIQSMNGVVTGFSKLQVDINGDLITNMDSSEAFAASTSYTFYFTLTYPALN